MHSTWLNSSFLTFSKFPQIQEGEPNLLGEPILQNSRIIWFQLQYFNFKNLKDSNSWSLLRFQLILHPSAVLFSDFQKFLKFKRGDLISLGEPIVQNGWINWSFLLYFNFKNLKEPDSMPFNRFQCILHDSSVFFSDFQNFLKFKRGHLISWGQPILQNGWISWSTLPYFSFKNMKNPNSASLIRFQCILHYSPVLFSNFQNFRQFKTGDLIS